MAEEWDYGGTTAGRLRRLVWHRGRLRWRRPLAWRHAGGTPIGGAGDTTPRRPVARRRSVAARAGGNWWQSILGSLGGLSGVLGPPPGGGALAGGAIGSNASSDAARLQSNALNRGLDLQTAQWLQQQANQAPWLQAGQQALPQLMKLAGQEPPGAFQGPPSISGQGYALPPVAPTWGPQGYQGPQNVNAQDYRYTPGQVPSAAANRWTPGQGPQAADYRYTPGQTPDAAQYASQAPATLPGGDARHAGVAAHGPAGARSGPRRGLPAE